MTTATASNRKSPTRNTPAREAAKPSHLLARLKDLAGEAGEMMIERIGIAGELLRDKNWIDTEFKSEAKARDWLQQDFFADLCGTLTLGQLLTLHEKFTPSTWKEHKFNLKRLWAEYKEQQQATKPNKGGVKEKERKGPIPRKDFDAVVEEKKQLETTVSQSSETVAVLRSERDRLQQRVHELEMENSNLRGRLEEMERLQVNGKRMVA